MTDDAKPDETGCPPSELMRELARAEHDVLTLGEQYGLGLPELSAWAARPETQRTVAGLCLLADLQTQLLLSRYRLVAATRLVGQATGRDESLTPEQVRKACVDLLKIELDRVASLSAVDTDGLDDSALEALRNAMHGPSDDPTPNPTEPQ